MATTPNYGFAVYSSTDTNVKFLDFRTSIAGTNTTSNFYKIDSLLYSLSQSCLKTLSSTVSPDPETGNIDPTSPMLMSSLTATSAADRLDHVVIPGKTIQEGSGDPSPANVRPLSGVGRKMVEPILDGSADESIRSVDTINGKKRWIAGVKIPLPPGDANTLNQIHCNWLKTNTTGTTYAERDCIGGYGESVTFYHHATASMSTEELRAYLSKKPLYLWYVPADESQATGWYTYAAVDGDTYAAVGLPLNGPLYDGDKVSNNEPSGCDVEVTFDGSEDEGITLDGQLAGIVRVTIPVPGIVPPSKGGKAYANYLPNVASYSSAYPHFYVSEAGQKIFAFFEGDSLDTVKSNLQKNPLVLWYTSTNYATKNDIRAEIETHGDIVYTLTGDEAYVSQDIWKPGSVTINSFMKDAVIVEGYSTKADITCSHLVTVTAEDVANRGYQGCAQGGGSNIFLNFGPSYNTKELAVQYIKDQYAAGTPVQIKAKRATPAVYAHPAQPLKNPEGEWELSGENTPVGYMKALCDPIKQIANSKEEGIMKLYEEGGNATDGTMTQKAITTSLEGKADIDSNGFVEKASYASNAVNANISDSVVKGNGSSDKNGYPGSWYAPPGMVVPYAGDTAPDGWLLCDGANVSSEKYPDLYAVIGTKYGSGKAGTFNLPDLRKRVPAGASAASSLGHTAGSESVTLTIDQMPSHVHSWDAWAGPYEDEGTYSGLGGFKGSRWSIIKGSNVTYEGGYGLRPTGGGQPHDNMQPTIYLYYIIKY